MSSAAARRSCWGESQAFVLPAPLCHTHTHTHALRAGCTTGIVLTPRRWRCDFSPLAVFAIPCYMATFARGAPLPERSTLVEDPQSQEIVRRSRSLMQKILLSIPDTHKSCIHTEVRSRPGGAFLLVCDVSCFRQSWAHLSPWKGICVIASSVPLLLVQKPV